MSITPATIMVEVLLFSHIQADLGRASIRLKVPAGSTVADVLGEIRGRLSAHLRQLPLGLAVNDVLSAPDIVLQAGDRVALLPPIQGG